MTFVLPVILAMMLVITGGGGAALHEGGPWQVYAPNLQSYLQVNDTWPIPDPTASVPLPRYAFAQVSGNTPPVVHAGGDLTVGEGDTVMLSGFATDTDGDPITYTWSQTGPATPRITFANASASSTTFTAPSVTDDTVFTFVLTAHDGTQPATDMLNVTVKETDAAFITTWAVSDSDRNITLPMMGAYSILWGDGSHSPDVDDSQFHSYDAAGIYTVTVLGEGLENIYLHGDTASARQLRSIEQWGDTKWTTMKGAFGRAANMVYHATDAPNLSGVTDMTYMFFNTASFDGDLSDWNVSSVTHMTYMFLGASAFNGDISGWDVSSVTNMYHTFEGASVFNGDISGWDVSSVTDMNSMFFLASTFDGDISGWDVSSVTNMGNMFLGASSFDGDISGWDVSSVTAMPSMFISTPIFNQNLGTWYIVPARTDFDVSGSSLDVTTISAQNPYLSGQNSTYGVGSGGNSDLFEMRGSTLAFRSTPDVGSYTVKVTASGNSIFENGNNWRMLEITVRSSANDPPTVDAGQGQTVNEGDAVTLNGTASDLEGDQLTYLWSHDSVLPITVSNATSQLTTFTAPAVDSDVTVTFVLSVSDGTNTDVTDQVAITIQDVPTNIPPTVDAGQDQVVDEGDAVTLNGTASDLEGDQLTYLWSHDSVLPITVSNATSQLTTFTAPAVDSDVTVTFVLSVSDGTNTDVTDQVAITIQDVPTNIPPTVDAGQDQVVDEGDAVTLNGTASDLEGDQLTYLWSHDSVLPITVSNATSQLTTFTAPAVDSDVTVTFVLSVSDGTNTDVTDQVAITIQDVPTNIPPTVDAGQDQVVDEGDAVTLNGTASDLEGDQLTYLWSHDSVLPITVSNATSQLTTFTAPAVDSDVTVTFVLSVSDGTNTDVTDQVAITIQDVPTNIPPTVDAGQDQVVDEGDAVTLNGTASDLEGDQLTYLWSHDSVLPITVSNATSQLTTFTAPAVDSDVTVTFVLSVSDGTNTDVTDQVTITIQDVPTNNPPTVDAGQDQTVNEGDAVTLNGTASDHEGDHLTYLWSHDSVLPITVSNATSQLTTFTAPAVDSDVTVTFVLSVSDGTNTDVTDQVTITIQDVPTNNPPTVDAGQDQVVDEGDAVTLNGTASDLEGDQLTYLWSHDSVLPITVSNATSQLTTFTAPAVDSDVTVTFVLSVSDGTNTDVTDQVTITIQDVPTNNPPTVDAGQDQTVNEGDAVTLNGTASDHEGDHLTYLWSHDSVLPITVSNATSQLTTFTAPLSDSDTVIAFTLNVTDGAVYVHDTMTVTVRGMPVPDIADVTSITPDGPYHPGQIVDVRINFTRSVNLEAFTIQDGGRDTAGGTFTIMDRPSGLATVQIGDSRYALVSTVYDDGVQIIDITDPASPVAVAAIADGTSYPNLAGGYAITTVQRGNLYYALVASQSNNGVQIINITDPASPTPVAAFNDGATYTELLGAYSITTTQIGDSHYALVTGFSDHGVQIINITDIANPAPAAALQTSRAYSALLSPTSVTTVQIGDSHYALVASKRANGVQIINITDPVRPSPVTALIDGQAYQELEGAYSITTTQIGNLHYALVAADSDDGVQIIDITDPAHPLPVAALTDGQAYTELEGATSITTTQIGDSHYALVASIHDDGVQIIDITDPAHPLPVAALTDGQAYPELEGARTVITTQIGDSHYALVAGVADKGIQIIDITDPAHPFNPLMPYMRMDLDGDRRATYVGQAHGNHTLIFEYVVKDGDQTGDLAYSGIDALVLGHSGLTDTGDSSNLSNVTLPEPGAPHSLSHNKQIDLRAWPNGPPTVDAGQDQTVNEGDILTLNGTASDPEGDQLTYLWSHDSVLPITVSNATSQLTTFTAPAVDSDVTVTFVLSVSDGTNTDVTDQVTITIQDVPTNNPPTVDAGQDQTVDEGDVVTLSGTASDPEGDQLTYLWSHDSVLPITVSNATSQLTTFTAPAVDSDVTVTFVLSVSDGTNTDVTDQVTITIQDVPTNNPPTVDAGQDQTVNEGDILTLNGTASDADGDAMIYLWSHDSDLEITLDNPSSVSVSFTVPQVTSNATITFTMTVTDKHNATGSDAVVISILDIPADDSQDPIADQFQKNTVVWNMSDPHGSRDIIRITLSSAAPGTIHATWDVPSEAPANYRISWAKAGESYLTWTDLTGNAFPTDPPHTITGLRDGEAYKVKVRASYAGTSGDWSDDVIITVTETVSNTPATGLPVIGGTVQVEQTLTVDTSGIADVNGMVNATLIYQWISSDGATDTDIAEATTSRYVLTDGDQGRVIKVQVTFTDDTGHAESRTSDTTLAVAPASTVPGIPTGLNVLQGNSGTLNVSWQIPISDGGSAITGYTIQWKAASGNWTVPADVSEATATGTTHTITGLTDGTPYTVRIIATNHVGDGEPTLESTAIPMTSQQLGPRDIGRVTLSSTTPGVIDSSWVAPTEAPAAYRISWANVGGSYKTWTDLSGNAFPTATSQTITGLERGEAYKVKVRATYAGTSGDWSDDVIITVTETVTNTLAIGPPAVQTGDDQTVGEGDTVTLSGSPTDPDDDPITYTWSQTDPTTPLITFVNASAPSTTFTAPSVTGDTVFTLVLTADDGTYSATDTLSITVKETGTAFITTWTASDSDRSITLPMEGTYSVLWGDDTYSADVGGFQSHTYGAAGTYTVIVLGDGLEYIRLYDDSANARQLGSIEQWGDTKWITMDRAFGKAANMVYRATHVPDLSGVTDMTYMFFNAASFDGDLSSWNVSGVTDMSGMFRDTTSFNGNLSAWDVSRVTDMDNVFHGATSFNGDLSSWNVSGVTDMDSMFFETRSFNGNLSAWDVSGVTGMFAMFHDAASFNGNLSAWNVSEVTDMSGMFHGATYFNGDLSAWNVSGVTDMRTMFHEAGRFNGDLSAWNVSGVTDMNTMFDRAISFNGDLSAWDVSEVTDMNGMFYRATSFNGDLSTWDVSKVTKMIYMFRGATSFNGDISSWDVSRVTEMSGMFRGATSFNGDISSWDVSRVTDMSDMFYRAISFNGDLSTWDVSRVTEMSGMFRGATSFNGDISSWDVSRVTEMSGMFHGATSFNQNLGAWYVVLDGDTMPSSTDSIGIAAQNRMLNDQNPIYTIDEAATNGDKFRIANGTHLALRADQTVAQGQYNVTIKSTGSFGVGNSRIVEITVGEDAVPQTNNPPSVEAGPAQVVSEGSKVRLNGSATDHDGDQLTYSWSHNSTLDISLVNASAPSTTFTAPPVTGDTTFTLVLTADDGTYSATDTLSITVKETSTAFITTWTASNYDRSITLPMEGTYSILWGDGTYSADVDGSQSHTYGAAAETYTVTVLGDGLESINLRNDTVNALQLRSIEQWGDTKWTVMEEAFDGAVNMVYRATDAPDLSGVTDMSRMFNGASAFNGDISGWNVSSVTDMSSMFNGTTAFNQNLGTWYIVPAGTSPDVTTAISAQNQPLRAHNPTYGMGSGGDSDLFEMRGSTLVFKSAPDAGSYTANVTASGSAVFESGNNWRMLEITVRGPPVVQAGGDQTVGEGDTVRLSGSATDPNGDSITYTWSQTDPAAPLITFANASAPSTTFTAPQITGDTVFTLVLTADDGTDSATDTLSITVKETGTAFITTWTASNSDRSITLPIKGAYSILWGDGTYSANVGGFQSHTYGAAAETYTVTVLGDGLKRIHLYGDSANARQLRSIEQWGDTKWISMYESFYGAVNMVYRATDAPNLSRVTDMNRMFAGATAINGDLSGWDVSSVTDMSSMFYTAYAFNGDLSGWDVSSVTTMRYMFFGAHAFNGNLSGWDVSSVATMNGMFASAHAFNGDLSGWDVSSVTDMGSMFYEAVIFNQPLDGWDVSSVTDMDGMFHSAYTFNQSLDDWDVSSVTYMRNMFYDAVAFNQNLGTWYIVPAGTDFDAGDNSLIVTTVSAQNLYLGDHNLTYGIGSGGDSDLFEMTGSTLAFKSAPNAGSYTVKVTASGNDVFENGNNWRMLEITVHDSADG